MTSTLFFEVPFNRLGAAGEPNLNHRALQKPGGIKRMTHRITQGFQIYEGENSMIPAVKARG
jgi:hypothetical protein